MVNKGSSFSDFVRFRPQTLIDSVNTLKRLEAARTEFCSELSFYPVSIVEKKMPFILPYKYPFRISLDRKLILIHNNP